MPNSPCKLVKFISFLLVHVCFVCVNGFCSVLFSVCACFGVGVLGFVLFVCCHFGGGKRCGATPRTSLAWIRITHKQTNKQTNKQI